MSEAKTKEEAVDGAEAPKKKSKLPLILGVVMLLVGIFVGAKVLGGGGKQEPPPIELGKTVELEEFLVNLKDGRSYLRTKMSLHLVKGFKEEGFKELLPAVRDAIILCLSSMSYQDANSFKGKEDLKVEIAHQVNEILNEGGPKVHEEKKPQARPDKKTVDHPDWDSQEGPVLKVYYTDFATQ
jgi:flagellar FliL protein